MSQSIHVVSLLSEKANATGRKITQYLGEQLGISTEFVDRIPWSEQRKLLDTQQIHLGWICGIDYVRKIDSFPSSIELVAAPVMQHPRYKQQPIYFSDAIARSDSKYYSFADLRGSSWAYNEPGSHSGYNIVQYHLAKLGETQGYFGRVIEAGSHLQAIEMVLEQGADAAAIDSMVLDLELQTRPELRSKLRVIETLGPSPIPPWVVTTNLPVTLREDIRQVFWQMHETVEGRGILAQGQIMKMVRIEDFNYNPIREMVRISQHTILQLI